MLPRVDGGRRVPLTGAGAGAWVLPALQSPFQLTYWLLLTIFVMAMAVGLVFVGLLVYGLIHFHVREVPAHLKNVARTPPPRQRPPVGP
jgi:hypothetical protein